uniref:AH domain-containing protein n=1 Tax=Elaeophora elaphi TaxID=1147741 RepID=A0A0R3RKY0_9BILA
MREDDKGGNPKMQDKVEGRILILVTDFSGLNFDRFVDRFDEPTLNKMRQQYWTTKQLIRKKLGKKEDEHLLASDAEFDTKIALFRFVQETSDQMLCCIDDYQHYLSELVQVEFELSKMLKENGGAETTAAGRVMVAVARAMTISVHHNVVARLQIRNPLLRFFGELHVFTERAILDCADTVDAAEKARIEYRGSLLWMKKTSKELDPDAENILEKFRTAQSVVRRNKEKLDNLKLDTLQKVDLLVASRYNLFSQLLESYQKSLYNYFEQTTLAYEKIYDFVSSRKHYEFEVLTDLIEPLKELGCENDDAQMAPNERESESLIELDQCEQEMEQVLQELENLNGHDLLGNRMESPLGLPREKQNGDCLEPTNDIPKQTLVSVESHPISEASNTTIPAIAPPPGWKSNRTVARPSSDLVDLLSLDDTISGISSLASDWSKLVTSVTAPDVVAASSPVLPSSSSLALPSQLLQFPSVESGFPNPFADSTDPNFDVWKGLLDEFETAEVGGSGVFKNC